jgi:hypothetical protein
MEQVSEFLQKIKLQKEADALLKASYNTNEASVAHLLNNKSDRHATGKLAEYKQLMNTCKFKLVVYFRVDKWGREFTVQEKKEGKHRRPIPSVDRVGKKHDEELSLNTLIDYCLKNAANIDSAQIFLNDRINGNELMVFKFNAQTIAASDFREMLFKTNEYGNRYFMTMIDQPIRTDKIKP